MSFFISAAHANAAAPQPGPGGFGTIGMILFMIVIFYFLIIRPQNKRQKEHNNMLGNLGVGDEVSTNAGILGKVKKLDENYVVLKVADNVELKFQKGAILAVLPKGTIKAI